MSRSGTAVTQPGSRVRRHRQQGGHEGGGGPGQAAPRNINSRGSAASTRHGQTSARNKRRNARGRRRRAGAPRRQYGLSERQWAKEMEAVTKAMAENEDIAANHAGLKRLGLAFVYTAWGIMVWIIFAYGAPPAASPALRRRARRAR